MPDQSFNLDFEKPLEEIRRRIEELRQAAQHGQVDLHAEIEAMEQQQQSMVRRAYANLTPWQEVLVARHPMRPQTRDYLRTTFRNFVELHGDRAFADDHAIVTGFAEVGAHRVLLVGEHKGRTVEERRVGFAGCPHPEGYRKALHKMDLAEKFGLPVVTLIDTKGAYPGTGGEERGVGPAIAANLRRMSRLRVPVVIVVIGEGGSGGALGIGIGDRVYMLQHAYYSVISPEGCAAILWRDASRAPEAAAAMCIASRDLKRFELIDEIITEPVGGAHKDPEAMGRILGEVLARALDELCAVPIDDLLARRYERLRAIGQWEEATEDRLREILSPPPEPAAPEQESATPAPPDEESKHQPEPEADTELEHERERAED